MTYLGRLPTWDHTTPPVKRSTPKPTSFSNRQSYPYPETLRSVFILREFEGYSTEEVAEMLGIGASAEKVRLHRARLRLRESLAPYFSEESDVDNFP